MSKKKFKDVDYDYLATYKLNKATVLRFQLHEVRTRKMLLKLFSEAMSDRFDVWLPRVKYGATPGSRTGVSPEWPYIPLKLVARYVATSNRLHKEKLKTNDVDVCVRNP